MMMLLTRLTVAGSFAAGVAVCAAIAPGWLAAAAVLVILTARPWPRPGSTHGTARFASRLDVRNAGMGRRGGLHLGRLVPSAPHSRWAAAARLYTAPLSHSADVLADLRHAPGRPPRDPGPPLWMPKFTHCAVVGASGSGKGAGIVVPTLLAHRGPVVVLDVKGELYQLTAAARRKLGRKVHALDPYRLVTPDGGVSVNPMCLAAPGGRGNLDLARDLACALVVRPPSEHQPFFNDSATMLLHGFIAQFMDDAAPEMRTLEVVADAIADPKLFRLCVSAMQASGAHGGVLRRIGRQAAGLQDREYASVVSTVATHVSWLNSQAAAGAVGAGTFDPLSLKTGGADLFLVIPPERMRSASGLVRYVLAGVFRRLMDGPADEERPVLVVLDEASTLGALPVLEEAVTLMRGWGVKLVFVFQSLGQIHDVFPGPKAKTFLANTSQVYLKTNDFDTAKLISEMIGQSTVWATSAQRGGSYSRPTGGAGGPGSPSQPGQWSTSWGVTRTEQGRMLVRPEEVLHGPPRAMYVFTPDTPPILAEQVRWYERDFRRPRRATWPLQALALAAAAAAGLHISAARPRPQTVFPAPPARAAGAGPDTPRPGGGTSRVREDRGEPRPRHVPQGAR